MFLAFAQTATNVPNGFALPDWLPPVVIINVALAAVVAYGNYKGYWVTGREHRDSMDALRKWADYVEKLRKEEQTQRLQDAEVLGRVTDSMKLVHGIVSEIDQEIFKEDEPPPPPPQPPRKRSRNTGT